MHIFYLTGGGVLYLLLLAFLAVQFQQWMLRWRSERLIADMHKIHLDQSTWTDAQQLMNRWGAWGHYDGSCTATSCEYEIRMTSITFYNPHVERSAWLDWLLQHDRLNLYEWFGGRGAGVLSSFIVNDGKIWKKDAAVGLRIPMKIRKEGEFEPTLFLTVRSIQQLHEPRREFGASSSDDELAQYPYYKVESPGGCMINCQVRTVYYSARTPPDEIKRLTSFDFSCFTRFKPCTEFGQLLPAVKEWNP